MTLQDCAARAAGRLVAAGFTPESARIDVSVLARAILGWDQARWLAEGRTEASPKFERQLDAMVRRRATHEPVAYIVGEREFFGRAFVVSRDVLIPRPDTECVLEAGLRCLERLGLPAPLVVDVGTGSGCLAISVAADVPEARVVATDTFEPVLAVAHLNARRLLCADRISFRLGPMLADLAATPDLIISNPPYVRDDEWRTLPPDVLDFEPAGALFAGPEGLDVIRELVAVAGARLAPGGWLVSEIGAGQADAVRALVDAQPVLELVEIVTDIESRPRGVVARRRLTRP